MLQTVLELLILKIHGVVGVIYLCLKLSAYKKGTSITLDLSIGFLDGEIYSSFFTMKL